MSDFCVAKFQTHPLSGKSSIIPENDTHAISRRNVSSTTLDLPERGKSFFSYKIVMAAILKSKFVFNARLYFDRLTN